MNLAAYRKEYALGGLRRADLADDPIAQFEKWFQQAVTAEIPEPTAMALATVDALGQPSLRTVLLKAVDQRGFVFCTSYESRKARDLAENSRAAISFLWKEMERQVCVTGIVSKVSSAESDIYFDARPPGSQLGALASQQSSVVTSREVLEKKFQELEAHFSGRKIPRPSNWGGYVVAPATVQFWQGGVNRLHDRFCYRKNADGSWLIERLSP
ncbi:MAG: pyridoxamine 5'-phosphate oxidase [Verrucomicrobiota bacterium]